MAGSSPAMTKKRKVDDARRPTTANAIRAKIGEGLERILKPRKIFKKSRRKGTTPRQACFVGSARLFAPQPKRAAAPRRPSLRGAFFAPASSRSVLAEELAHIGWGRRRGRRGATRVEARLRGRLREGRPSVNGVNPATREFSWIGADISAGRGTI